MSKTFLVLILSFVLVSFARAHDPGLSTLKLQRDGQQIRATLIFAGSDMNVLIPLDENNNGNISAEESAAAQEVLRKLAANLLEVSLDENPLPILETKCFYETNDNFRFEMTFASSPGTFLKAVSKWVLSLPPGHRQFVSF